MQYITHFNSPMGEILLAADEIGLTGVWFEDQKYFADNLEAKYEEKNVPVLEQTERWLSIYFSGKEPDFTPAVHIVGTPFQVSVWKILQEIPYGQTITYGEIAEKIAKEKEISKMSAQAVGGAVGRNHISIIIPCHRVVGAKGNLTGYAGGIDRKLKLLKLEKADTKNFFIPKKGIAL